MAEIFSVVLSDTLHFQSWLRRSDISIPSQHVSMLFFFVLLRGENWGESGDEGLLRKHLNQLGFLAESNGNERRVG